MSERAIVARELRFVNKGALAGIVTLEVTRWRMLIKGCRWFRKDGREWIGLPSEKYERDGKVKWKDLVEFTDDETRDRFQEAALDAVHELAERKE